MAHQLPTCKNSTCPNFHSNKEVIVLQERKEDVTFGCKTCGGVQVRTLDWRRAQQVNYERLTNPEYARQQKRFFLGKYAHRGG
jgi:hypothetical protein